MTDGRQNDVDLFDSTVGTDAERYCPTCDSSYPMAMLRCPNDGTSLIALADDDSALIGLEIDGRFTIESKLGSGGMGGVYVAVQHSIGRQVAIKVIHGHLSRDRNSAKRFLRETKLASRLSHPNTVTVLDFGQTPDHRLYMVMEMVDGVTLSTIIRQGALPSPRAIEIAIQICGALEAAAKLQIVHRDLKPANIMIKSGGGGRDFVKVLDFGLAKSLASEDSTVTESHMIVGTPHYLPPELALGDPVDTRSDLYSLGVVLYAMVAGKLPFRGETVQAVLFSQVNDPPPPLPTSVPRGLANVILRLLAKRPDLRFQSAAETRDALTTVRDRPEPAVQLPNDASIGTDATLRPPPATSPAKPSSVIAESAVDSSLFPDFASVDATAPKSARVGPGALSAAKNFSAEAQGVAVVGTVTPKRRRWIIPVVLLALIAAGLGGFLATQRGKQPRTLESAEIAGQTGESEAQPLASSVDKPLLVADAGAIASDAATEPATVTFKLESRPKGAQATVAGVGQCVTPCSIDVALSAELSTIEFTKSGFQRAKRRVSAQESQTVIGEMSRRQSGRSPGSSSNSSSPKKNDSDETKKDTAPKKPKDDFIPSYDN